jgi:hypothetical protein
MEFIRDRRTRHARKSSVLFPFTFPWLLVLALASCTAAAGDRSSRLSGAVAFASESPQTIAFLSRPGIGYVQAYLRFGPNLADDVIMFVDQEILEGLAVPRWVKGGDWMAFVGVQRSGAVWVAGGTDKTMQGNPSGSRNWSIHNLGQRLQPDVWYRVRIIADFDQRRFVSFTIEGSDLKQTLDLSKIRLDYPNYMPFDRAGMIYIVGAMRGRDMMRVRGTPLIYFDDIEGGAVDSDGKLKRLFFDGFESQTSIGEQPVTAAPIKLDDYRFSHWYLERKESLFRIKQAPFARSGNNVGIANVTLDN